MTDRDELQFIVNHVGDRHKTCAKLIDEARDLYKLFKEPAVAPVAKPKPLLEEAEKRNAVRNNFIKKETHRIKKEFGLPEANAKAQAEQAWLESKEKAALQGALNRSRKNIKGYFQEGFEAYNTIEKVNAYIGQVMTGKLTGNTAEAGSVKDTIPTFCKKRGDAFIKGVCGWKLYVSSGQENDCLIHTFLTMVSPNFRRLAVSHKNELVDTFRRILMPKLPPRADEPAEVRKRSNDLFKSGEMLTDTELKRILTAYGLNAVLFEKGRTDIIGGARFTQPDNVNVLTYNDKNDRYFLLSLKGRHYEAVSTETGEFTIPIETALEIGEKFKQEFTGEAKLKCAFDEGDKVNYKGSEYFIIERQSNGANEPSCISVTLVNKADYDKYLKLKDIRDSKRNETSYRMREFKSIQNKVPIGELKVAAAAAEAATSAVGNNWVKFGGKRCATRRRGAAAKRRSLRRHRV